jgi:diguanylate cyclase (GGDEF)-like protein
MTPFRQHILQTIEADFKNKLLLKFSLVLKGWVEDARLDAQLAEQEQRILRDLAAQPDTLIEDARKLQDSDMKLGAYHELMDKAQQRLKGESILQNLPDHIRTITAALAKSIDDERVVLANEAKLLLEIEQGVQKEVTPRLLDAWLKDVADAGNNFKVRLRETRTRVMIPFEKFTRTSDYAVNLARVKVANTQGLITREMIAKDIATFVSPYEFQKYQAILLRHRNLLDNSPKQRAEEFLMKASMVSAQTSKYRFFTTEMLSGLTTQDPLTGAFNRRWLKTEGPAALSEVRRHNHPVTNPANIRHVSVLALDLDHFKGINDIYGHAAGDEVLKTFVQILQKTIVRKEDAVVRYGGEEFVVLLRNSNTESAEALARKILYRVSTFTVPLMRSFNLKLVAAGAVKVAPETLRQHITVSIGIATYPDDVNVMEADSFDALVQLADKRLYTAKDNGQGEGRNRAVSEKQVILGPRY